MDFHHLEDKDGTIARMVLSGSKSKIEAEIAKCVLICSNCHRIRHHGLVPKDGGEPPKLALFGFDS